MHFVYKTDNLFRSIRVSYGSLSVTKGFPFFWTYLNSIVFLCSKCTIQSHIINFQPFLTSFVISHAFTDFFSYKDLKLKSTTNELWKGWKLAWYHHFTHIACARKYRGLRQRLDALHAQNGQSLSKYQGFIRKLICYKGISFFLNLFELPCFYVFKMHHSKPHHQFTTLSDFICYFSCIYWLFWAIRPWNWKTFEMNSEKVPSCHGIIISPT